MEKKIITKIVRNDRDGSRLYSVWYKEPGDRFFQVVNQKGYPRRDAEALEKDVRKWPIR